jgi:hypothetical protein
MKKIHYIFIALACSLFTACMDGDWDEPSYDNGAPFGNNELTEDGLTTIAELKTQFKSVIDGGSYAQITNDVKIKATVTGNDLGGNIYKQLFVEDATGAICIAINQSGLNGFMAEGQEILISLKDLYIGGYGRMAQIGTPYNNNGRMQIGRMAQYVWANHFKVVNPKAELITPQPVDFNTVKGSIDANAGKLVVLKGVIFANANGKKRLVDGVQAGGNYYNQSISGMSNVVVRTSSYADFAAMVMPYDTINKKPIPCDIVGIAGRFNNDWQILIRKTSDISLTK